MKRALLSISLLFCIFSLSSCVIIDEGDSVKRKTEAAKIIFDNVEDNISAMVDLCDMAVKLSRWIDAPESSKAAMEDLWFPDYKLRYEGGKWIFRDISYYFTTGGKSLDSLDSEWIVGYGTAQRMTIKCTGKQTWNVTCNGSLFTYNYHLSKANITLTGRSPLLSGSDILFDYDVSGEGSFITNAAYSYDYSEQDMNLDNSLTISYKIDDKVRFVTCPDSNTYYSGYDYPRYKEFRASEGEMDITIEDEVTETIHAEMISYTQYGVVKYLTFKGNKEVWTY
ncbi:MAG: hypothetical protein VB022_10025 [Rikenellaceae bacterium]|nr:hypothetical protein [Rikenellaceae bacterium]